MNMKGKLKNIIKYAVSAALAVVLLWFSFRDVEWGTFMDSLKECRWEFVLLSMAAGSFAFWLRALRWRMLLVPMDPAVSRITAFNGINIGNISNFVLPRIGEFVRCGVITRRSRIPYEKVLGTVVLERSWELLVMLVLLALVIIGGADRFGAFFMEEILDPVASRFSVSVWWIVAVVAAVLAVICYAVWKLRERNAFCARIYGLLKGLLQGFASCLKMERKWLFFAYTAAVWGMYWIMAACTVWAAPFLEGLDLIDSLFLSLAGGIGFAVPVPGGIGAFHFVISLALSAIYGVPMEMGVLYATISHTSQAITQILFGLGSYAHESLRK